MESARSSKNGANVRCPASTDSSQSLTRPRAVFPPLNAPLYEAFWFVLAVVEAVSLLRTVSLTGKRNRNGHGKRRRGHGGEGAIASRSGATGRAWTPGLVHCCPKMAGKT